jgi:hypothetical protein
MPDHINEQASSLPLDLAHVPLQWVVLPMDYVGHCGETRLFAASSS